MPAVQTIDNREDYQGFHASFREVMVRDLTVLFLGLRHKERTLLYRALRVLYSHFSPRLLQNLFISYKKSSPNLPA
jgi:hypothetical protein